MSGIWVKNAEKPKSSVIPLS